MLKTLRVESAAERERFCSLMGLSALTPENMERSHADQHWLLEGTDGIQARCSLWWSKAPSLSDQRVGIIGHYAARDTETAIALLQRACTELARQGCTLAVGPMDGSTNRRYRLLSERGTEQPFFLEPDNPDDWSEHFTSSGFTALANYVSALQSGIERADPRAQTLAAQFAEEGISTRMFDAAHFEDEVRRIYRVVAASFRNTFLASPISEDDFWEQYRPIQPYIRPELVLLAERAEEPLGFIFAIPDWLQMQRGAVIDTLIVKTLAVHPTYSNRGLATLLSEQLSESAHELGYTRAIHALMHEQNVSRRISQTHRGQIIRRYTLYAKKLEAER
jgi:GNAT superfamily N-acetyltransferase